jgi:hypothetical protein
MFAKASYRMSYYYLPSLLIPTIFFYLQFLRASEGTLSRWSGRICSRLNLLQFQGGLTSGRQTVVKIIAESLSQHDEKHVILTPLSEIRVGKRRTEKKDRQPF